MTPTLPDLFLDAMARFPSGVTIVTTSDLDGRWWGFTATAFCAVSLEPPLVLVCLANSAECHPAFTHAQNWVVNVIHSDHADLARRFATRGADKFTEAGFKADENGQPMLGDACATLRCSLFARYQGGDHTILVGKVEEVRLGSGQIPAIYFSRGIRPLPLAN